MGQETAFPLYWPRQQKRVPAQQRIMRAPFSVGENYNKEVGHYENGQFTKSTVKAHRSKEVSVPLAIERLQQQLDLLGADHPVLSTNIALRLDGLPKGGQKDPDDPAAAVWFTLKGKRTVLACDKWVRVADNIAALAAHIRAIRSVENYGVGTLEQAFTGYLAIEDYSQGNIPWRRSLGFRDDERPSLEQVREKFRARAKEVHPDREGSHQQMLELNVAFEQARLELT